MEHISKVLYEEMERLKPKKINDLHLRLHELEVQVYDDILSLDISDQKKDSICGKLNELLNILYKRVWKWN